MRGEIAAFNQFHAEVNLALVLADFVNGHDAGVGEPGSGGGFDFKTLDQRWAGEFAGGNEFKRDLAVERNLACVINNAHAAAGDFGTEFVIAKEPERVGWRRGMGV